MAARLESEDATRRRLLADVSHELRIPLAVIQGNVEALLDGVYPADEAHLAPLLEEIRVMSRLIEDLRTLSLAESGALPLHREPTDIAALLEDVAASHHSRPGPASLRISVVIEDDEALPLLDIDPVRIRQVLSNLVDNAVRHVPAGGFVELQACRVPGAEPAAVTIVVADNGPGIPADLATTAFERFTKGSASRGSGLGLAIARAIVAAHGGTIRLKADGAAGDAPAAPTSGEALAAAPPTGTRIEIVLPIG